MKRCPRCDHALEEIAFWGLRFDGCRGCGGVWFEADELTRLTRSPKAGLLALESEFGPDFKETKTSTPLHCPTCEKELLEFEFKHSPGIHLDGCRQCKGIWVDEGELAAIHQRLTAVQPPSREPRETPPEASSEQRVRETLSILLQEPCPSCGEPNPSSNITCWACGGPLKETPPALWGQMVCPACGHPLSPFTCGELRLDGCARCGGIWFDQDELRRVREEHPQALEEIEDRVKPADPSLTPVEGTSRLLPCPVCEIPLTEYTYVYTSSIRLDRCDRCHGMWVDEGELAAMQEQLEADAKAHEEDLKDFGMALQRIRAVGDLEARQQQLESRYQALTRSLQMMQYFPTRPLFD